MIKLKYLRQIQGKRFSSLAHGVGPEQQFLFRAPFKTPSELSIGIFDRLLVHAALHSMRGNKHFRIRGVLCDMIIEVFKGQTCCRGCLQLILPSPSHDEKLHAGGSRVPKVGFQRNNSAESLTEIKKNFDCFSGISLPLCLPRPPARWRRKQSGATSIRVFSSAKVILTINVQPAF